MLRKTMILIISMIIISIAKGFGCQFPIGWQTTWYSGHSESNVVIGTDSFSGKGLCTEQKNNLFLIENTDSWCFLCLKIEERNKNILQYQESHCGTKASLEEVCSLIVPSMWHTLFKDNYQAQAFPFHDAYNFGYANNSGGVCNYPPSVARPCASETQYQLQFQHCPTTAYTYRRDSNLICLGTWEQDDKQYMAAKFESSDISSKQHKFRCLICKEYGTLLHVSMSADASCRGLRTARDGPVVMEMTKDVFGWHSADCDFPHWHFEEHWRDLSARWHYHTNRQVNTISMQPILSTGTLYGGGDERVEKSFRCQKINRVTHYEFGQEITALTFASDGCLSYFQCIKYQRRNEGILHFTAGDQRTSPHACTDKELLFSTKTTLMLETAEPQPCPLHGMFLIHTFSEQCQSHLRSGCNASDTSLMDIKSSCASKPSMQLSCLTSWNHNGILYLIATRAGEPKGLANCFSFTWVPHGVEFVVDAVCNKDVPLVYSEYTVLYTLDSEPSSCTAVVDAKKLFSASQPEISENQYEYQKEYTFPPIADGPVLEKSDPSDVAKISADLRDKRTDNWPHSNLRASSQPVFTVYSICIYLAFYTIVHILVL